MSETNPAQETVAQPQVVETAVVAEPVAPVVVEPVVEPGADAAHVDPAANKVVYVEAPVAPKKKGNRGVGSLLALLSALIFGALLLGVALVINPSLPIVGFVTSATFYIPVLFFALGFIILVLLLNNAGWWAHVIGSLFVAAFVYFGSVGALLLGAGIVLKTALEAGGLFQAALFSPVMIAAALLAREVSLWMGAAISRRGRRVKAKNADARAAHEREVAEKKAEFDRANAGEPAAG